MQATTLLKFTFNHFKCHRNFLPMPLSVDHKPAREDEAQRIRDAGGFVINNRVMGELAVSRAFGDCEFKKGIQVCTHMMLLLLHFIFIHMNIFVGLEHDRRRLGGF